MPRCRSATRETVERVWLPGRMGVGATGGEMAVPLKAVHPAATPALILAESGTSFGPREARRDHGQCRRASRGAPASLGLHVLLAVGEQGARRGRGLGLGRKNEPTEFLYGAPNLDLEEHGPAPLLVTFRAKHLLYHHVHRRRGSMTHRQLHSAKPARRRIAHRGCGPLDQVHAPAPSSTCA